MPGGRGDGLWGMVAGRTQCKDPKVRSFRFEFVHGRCSMTAIVDAEKCTACESCVEACPLEAIEIKDDVAVVDEDTCGDCGACVDVCPVEAITLE